MLSTAGGSWAVLEKKPGLNGREECWPEKVRGPKPRRSLKALGRPLGGPGRPEARVPDGLLASGLPRSAQLLVGLGVLSLAGGLWAPSCLACRLRRVRPARRPRGL